MIAPISNRTYWGLICLALAVALLPWPDNWLGLGGYITGTIFGFVLGRS